MVRVFYIGVAAPSAAEDGKVNPARAVRGLQAGRRVTRGRACGEGSCRSAEQSRVGVGQSGQAWPGCKPGWSLFLQITAQQIAAQGQPQKVTYATQPALKTQFLTTPISQAQKLAGTQQVQTQIQVSTGWTPPQAPGPRPSCHLCCLWLVACSGHTAVTSCRCVTLLPLWASILCHCCQRVRWLLLAAAAWDTAVCPFPELPQWPPWHLLSASLANLLTSRHPVWGSAWSRVPGLTSGHRPLFCVTVAPVRGCQSHQLCCLRTNSSSCLNELGFISLFISERFL